MICPYHVLFVAKKEQAKELDNFDSENTVNQDGNPLDNMSLSGTDPSSGEDPSPNNDDQGRGVELGTFPANSSSSECNVSQTSAQHSSSK